MGKTAPLVFEMTLSHNNHTLFTQNHRSRKYQIFNNIESRSYRTPIKQDWTKSCALTVLWIERNCHWKNKHLQKNCLKSTENNNYLLLEKLSAKNNTKHTIPDTPKFKKQPVAAWALNSCSVTNSPKDKLLTKGAKWNILHFPLESPLGRH